MNTQLTWKKIVIGLIPLVVIIGLVIWKLWPTSPLGHGGPFESINYPAAIGTASSPSTLSSLYASTTSGIMLSEGLPNIAIGGTYTPKSYGSRFYMLVERSLDKGTTYVPYMTITPESGDVLVNSSGTSSTNGSPFVVPGNAIGTATSGTAIGYSFDLTLTADYIRISAKETTTSTAGTLNAEVLLTSN